MKGKTFQGRLNAGPFLFGSKNTPFSFLQQIPLFLDFSPSPIALLRLSPYACDTEIRGVSVRFAGPPDPAPALRTGWNNPGTLPGPVTPIPVISPPEIIRGPDELERVVGRSIRGEDPGNFPSPGQEARGYSPDPSLKMWDSTHPSWVGGNPACVPFRNGTSTKTGTSIRRYQ